jgi:hypothetical protein
MPFGTQLPALRGGLRTDPIRFRLTRNSPRPGIDVPLYPSRQQLVQPCQCLGAFIAGVLAKQTRELSMLCRE